MSSLYNNPRLASQLGRGFVLLNKNLKKLFTVFSRFVLCYYVFVVFHTDRGVNNAPRRLFGKSDTLTHYNQKSLSKQNSSHTLHIEYMAAVIIVYRALT